jgi:hypothetical protein
VSGPGGGVAVRDLGEEGGRLTIGRLRRLPRLVESAGLGPGGFQLGSHRFGVAQVLGHVTLALRQERCGGRKRDSRVGQGA